MTIAVMFGGIAALVWMLIFVDWIVRRRERHRSAR